MRTLSIRELTHENFKIFGEFISLEQSEHFPINAGTTKRFHALSKIDATSQNGEAIISLFRGQGFTLPFKPTIMERHPLGSQTFIPLTKNELDKYLIIVAPSFCNSVKEIIENLVVFVAKGFEGVTYAKGVWHHPLVALNHESDFIVIDRQGVGHNCDEVELNTNLVIGSIQ